MGRPRSVKFVKGLRGSKCAKIIRESRQGAVEALRIYLGESDGTSETQELVKKHRNARLDKMVVTS